MTVVFVVVTVRVFVLVIIRVGIIVGVVRVGKIKVDVLGGWVVFRLRIGFSVSKTRI